MPSARAGPIAGGLADAIDKAHDYVVNLRASKRIDRDRDVTIAEGIPAIDFYDKVVLDYPEWSGCSRTIATNDPRPIS